jgi:hypothetical protein
MFRQALLRKDLKRVSPKVASSPLIKPLVADIEEVIDKAVASAEYKYNQRIPDLTEAEIEAKVQMFIPNNASDQGILASTP